MNDMLVAKFNSAGTRLWTLRYDGPAHGNDTPAGILVDSANAVIVAGPSSSSQATNSDDFFTIKFGSNLPPLLVADVFDLPGERLDVLANDTEPEGDVMTLISVTQGATGVVTLNSDQTITYTPGNGFDTEDVFTYTVRDEKGATATTSVRIRNQAPTAVSDTISIRAELVIAVLANDTDPNQDLLTVSSVTQGLFGSVTIENGDRVRYSPLPGHPGRDHFSYSTTDNHGGTASATVEITNAIPLAVSDRHEMGSIGAVLINVLANDSAGDPGQDLRIVSAGDGLHGSVSIVDGKVRYIPGPSFDGTDVFTYTVTDGFSGYATGDVEIVANFPTQQVQVASGTVIPAEGGKNLWISSLGIPSLLGGQLHMKVTLRGDRTAQEALWEGDGLILDTRPAAPGVENWNFRRFGQFPGGLVMARLELERGRSNRANHEGIWAVERDGTTTLRTRELSPVPFGNVGSDEREGATLGWLHAYQTHGEYFRGRFRARGVPLRQTFAVWQMGPTGNRMLVRPGDRVEAAAGLATIVQCRTLEAVPGSGDHERWTDDSGNLLAWVALGDRSHGVISVRSGPPGSLHLLAQSGQQVGESAMTLRSIGMPSAGAAGAFAARGYLQRQAGMVTQNDDAVVLVDGRIVAREGEPAPGAGKARFRAFRDPVMSGPGKAAVVATVRGEGISANNREGLWSVDANGLALVVRSGDPAPEAGEGATFRSIGVIQATRRGPSLLAFTAMLNTPGQTRRQVCSLWVRDAAGRLHLVACENRPMQVFGGTHLLRAIHALKHDPRNSSEGRAFDDAGNFVFVGSFAGGSAAVIRLHFPSPEPTAQR
jgi:hypothetical protein